MCMVGAGAGVAQAGQIVFPSGTGIWVMNDDGTGMRQLVDAPQVSGMEYLGSPDIQPNGTEIAFVGRWNQASQEQNAFYPASPGFCGGNCEGIYELINGTVTRISPAPFACGGQPCESQETDPRVAADGRVAYAQKTYVSELDYGSWDPITGESHLYSRDSSGQNQIEYDTLCDGTSTAGRHVTDADTVSWIPGTGQIIYANCQERVNDGVCPGGYSTAYDTITSGASPTDTSDDMIVHSDVDPNAECLRDANTQIGDVDVSQDGTQVVEVHGGSGAGIYMYPLANHAAATELLAIPSGWTFWGLKFLGGGRIGFEAAQNPPSGSSAPPPIDIYTMPTSCTPAACDVSSGHGVTNLTGSHYLSYDYVLGASDFGYTASTAAIKAVPTSTGSGTTTTTPGGTTTTPGGTTTTPGGTTKPLTVKLGSMGAQKLKTLLKKGLTVTVTCSGACTLKAALVLGKLTLASAGARTSHAGKVKLTFHIKGRGRTKLKRARHAKLTLRVAVSQTHKTLSRTVTVH
jgi:hypothetical protein